MKYLISIVLLFGMHGLFADQEADYIPKIELYNVSAEMGITEPIIKYKLKNSGEKTIKRITVTFFFKDKDKNIIHEDNFYPLAGILGKPLKPGYIWRMPRGDWRTSRSVPSEWQSGSFDAKITNIEFLDNSDNS